jgi:hypothetical protein
MLPPTSEDLLLRELGSTAPLVAVQSQRAGRSSPALLAQHRPIAKQCRHDLDDIEPINVPARIGASGTSYSQFNLCEPIGETRSFLRISPDCFCCNAQPLRLVRAMVGLITP